jgi:hypothetical protein
LIEKIAEYANKDSAELLAAVALEAKRKAFPSDDAWAEHLKNMDSE